MEWKPEENNHAQYCEQCIQTLFYFLSHSSFFFCCIRNRFYFFFLSRSWEYLLVNHEDHQRNTHSYYRSDEWVVNTGVKYVEVLSTERSQVIAYCSAYLSYQLSKVSHVFWSHRRTFFNILVAQCRKISIVSQLVSLQPPFAKQRSYERSNQTTNVDKYIENLETRVTTALSQLHSFGSVFYCIFFKVVIHLTNDSLQVTLEQTVTECDKEQRHASKRQQPTDIILGRQYRNGKYDIS